MPEQLQPVINALKIAFDTSQTDLLIQGVVIALILGFMMARFGQLIYYVLAALVLDLIVVPLARVIYENEMNFGGALDYVTEILGGLTDWQAIAYRALFFAITIGVISLVKGLVRR